jgi:hypothetical protein
MTLALSDRNKLTELLVNQLLAKRVFLVNHLPLPPSTLILVPLLKVVLERPLKMKTSPRPKARSASKSTPMTKSPRPKSGDFARAEFMLKRQVRSGDGYAKGGMIKREK